MHMKTRRIGPIGTTTRLLSAAALLYLALFDGTGWGLEWYDAAVWLGVLPAAVIAFGLVARRSASGPVRFTGSTGTAANCVLLAVLAVNPYTAGGAALFYGTTLLVAAWRAQPGCEATVISNSILGRDDQLGCPVFSPIDQAEARLAAREVARKHQPRPWCPRSTTRNQQTTQSPPQSGDDPLDGTAAACQSRRVKSCGPSGSQDLAF
jgi:hypothetical protein